LAAGLIAAGLSAAGTAGHVVAGEANAGESPRLMIHVTFDRSFRDDRGLGAVRGESEGRPEYLPGALGWAATPGIGQKRVGILRVSRLSRIMLKTRTPAAGTILLWFRPLLADSATSGASRAPADSGASVLLDSDAPLHLAVAVSGFSTTPPSARLSISFDDEQGVEHRLEAPLSLPVDAPWRRIALAWDSETGAIRAFLDGDPVASGDSSPLTMPGLPGIFRLGAPGFAIDDFRLYNGFLEPQALADLAHAKRPNTNNVR
jgi:hypothetical protein